jgi:hypothetical protein
MVTKEYIDYIPYLKEQYPDISEAVLKAIVLKGLKKTQKLVNKNFDVKTSNCASGRVYSMKIIRIHKNIVTHFANAKATYYRLQKFRKLRDEPK